MKRITMLLGAGMLFLCSMAYAAVPQLINFQGVVKDSAGNTPAVDMLGLTFTIYDAPLGGAALWTESQSVTIVAGGLFSVFLGANSPIPDSVFADSFRWLGIKVETDPEMTPRQRLVSVGYSYRVSSVDGASGGTISGGLTLSGGNLNLEASSATAGNIFKGGVRFIHNFGTANTFIGANAGNLTMTGDSNTASGGNALLLNTSGYRNTASGFGALQSNTTGFYNTASGAQALQLNTTGARNTASGRFALLNNTTGDNNTAIGALADVSTGNLNNATAIGYDATVNASNKIRLGNTFVTVIEGQVAYTFPSDKNQKENFRPVDGNEVLRKIRGFELSSWNYKGHDPKQFRHYGPMAQDFFAAFGNDGAGKIGTETTLNSGDVAGILMIAVQALGNENADLKARIEHLEEILKEMQAEKPQAKVK